MTAAIDAEIELDGAIPFSRFMELALYGADGFYMSGGAAGRRGDFITGPEVGPLFGAVLARALDAWWDELGRPDGFTVVDAGAGPGTLARAVLAAQPECLARGRYVAVEVSPVQRERHPAGIESVAALPDGPITGVIVANELLDNLPFRLAVRDGGWREAYVTRQRDGSYAEVLRAVSDADVAGLPGEGPHGTRLPVQEAAGEWVADALARLERGRLVIVDYAVATTAELVGRPWRDWLRTYSGHDRGTHYLRDAGRQDITTDVAIDQLVRKVGEPDALRTQAQFLQRWGIEDLVEEGRRVWAANAAAPDLAAMRMRSRVREAEALLASPGLGDFLVVEYAGAPA